MAAADRPRQLPLDLRPSPGLTRDDLFVSPANARAVGLIERWPDWPAPIAVLSGPSGSGKSHLGAIWQEISGATAIAPEAASEAASRLAGSALLIDDVERAAVPEAALFHLVNAVRTEGGWLLMTARRPSSAWGLTLPDLVSRLQAATHVSIGEPDDMLLGGVMTKLFADRQVAVEPHVLEFMLRRIERSLATAIAVVERLDAVALERKTRISRALAAEVIAEFSADAEQEQG
jgi:chromosomal replication initiation ATPase DnaA